MNIIRKLLIIVALILVPFLVCSCFENYDGGAGWPHTCPASCYCVGTCTKSDGRTYTKSWQACSCRACTINIFSGTKLTDCRCQCGTNSIVQQVMEEIFEPDAPLTNSSDQTRQMDLFQPLLDQIEQ